MTRVEIGKKKGRRWTPSHINILGKRPKKKNPHPRCAMGLKALENQEVLDPRRCYENGFSSTTYLVNLLRLVTIAATVHLAAADATEEKSVINVI
jgi:hypothetical protein